MFKKRNSFDGRACQFNTKIFIELFKDYQNKTGLTKRELMIDMAEKINVSDKTIAGWYQGRTPQNAIISKDGILNEETEVVKIAKYFNVPVTELLVFIGKGEKKVINECEKIKFNDIQKSVFLKIVDLVKENLRPAYEEILFEKLMGSTILDDYSDLKEIIPSLIKSKFNIGNYFNSEERKDLKNAINKEEEVGLKKSAKETTTLHYYRLFEKYGKLFELSEAIIGSKMVFPEIIYKKLSNIIELIPEEDYCEEDYLCPWWEIAECKDRVIEIEYYENEYKDSEQYKKMTKDEKEELENYVYSPVNRFLLINKSINDIMCNYF